MNLHIKLKGKQGNDASIFDSTRITNTQIASLFLCIMQMIMHEIIKCLVNIHIMKIIQADMSP